MENKKYDLEKAKEDCQRHEDALEEAQSCMCGHCHECGFDPSEMKAALDEIERLRSDQDAIMAAWDKDAVEHDARIKALEVDKRRLEARVEYCHDQTKLIELLEAAFLEATKEIVYATHEGRDAPEGEDAYAEKVARDALERIKAGGKDD